MPRKFQDGDLVETLKSGPDDNPVGITGEVVGYYNSRYYLVSFEALKTAPIYKQLRLHQGTGSCTYGQKTCSWYEATDLKVAEAPNPKTIVDFETVILADDKKQQILEALEQINKYDLIFDKWGFGKTIEKGRGASMLFYGPPGTGKTLVCQAIAHKLNKPLLVFSTADIESPMPGEAERNIRKMFKDAKSKKAIVLLDECDSLLYSRQNVGPIMGAQSNELLQQIEKFEGIILFTTNRLGVLDEALNRRIALKLELPMPDHGQRAEIWKRMFPKEAPLAKDVDFHRLAVVEVTGGYIKNAVLRAVRMAAIQEIEDAKKKIKMKHLVEAIKQEAQAMIEFETAREEEKSGAGRIGFDMAVGRTRERVKETGVSNG